MMKRFLLSFAVLIILAGCGSTVTETTTAGDTSLSDIAVKDVVSERDTATEDDIIIDSEVSTDGGDDVSEQDSGADDSGSVEDVVEDIGDVIEEDISTSDVLSDTGTDAGGEDAGTGYCKVGDVKLYTCPDGSTVEECVCEYKGCKPECKYIGTKSEGWYDCEGKLIRYARCEKCNVECDKIGTDSEGWYSDCDGLIKWDLCAPEWKCVDDPASLCIKECRVGDVKLYTCPDGSTVEECVCEYKGCKPECKYIGTRSEGWYDCEGKLIRYARCEKCNVECDKIGTDSEGWYSDCDGLIKWDLCAPEWKCVKDPASLCVTKCQTPCDCPQDKPLCVRGICDSPIIIGCNNDHNLCPCGKYCSGNLCMEGSQGCMRSCDCPSGEICVNETCKMKIGTDCTNEPCPCDQYCIEELERPSCKKGCESNCDCSSDNPICIDGICGTLPIPGCGNDDRNCPCMEVCVNGVCEKATDICDSPCDCKDPAKPSCINMVCNKTPDKCINDLECPCGQFCIEGVCEEVRRCLSACDCKEGEICRDSICIKKLDNSCFNNNDCPCNYICQNFQCVKAQSCKYSCDCPVSPQTPLVCRNGLCQQQGLNNRCTIDNDCVCGNYCSSKGFCVQGCNDGCDCPKESPYCLFNRCSPVLAGECKQNSECPCEEVCRGGKCVSP